MQDTSAFYKTLLAAGDYRTETRLLLGAEGAVTAECAAVGMEDIRSMTSEGACFSTTLPSVGGVLKRKLTARFRPGENAVPRRAQLRPQLRLARGQQATEWLDKGRFYIERREPVKSYLDVTAYDAMYRADSAYPRSSLSWPATDLAVVREIAGNMHVAVDDRTAAVITKGYSIPWPSGSTMADVLAGIAASYAGNFVMSDRGELLLVPIWALPVVEGELTEETDAALTFADTNITVTAGRGGIAGFGAAQVGRRARKLTVPPALGAWQRVELRLGTSDEEAAYTAAGEPLENGQTLTAVCPWATQAMANDLLALMYGVSYQPYSAERASVEPAAELGDGVVIGRIYGGLYSQALRFRDGATSDIEAPGAAEITSEFPRGNATDRAFARDIQSVRSELTVETGRITQSVADLTSVSERLQADLRLTAQNLALAVAQWEDDSRALSARLDLQAEAIEAIVEDESPDGSRSIGMEMDLQDGWAIVVNGDRVFEVGMDGTVRVDGEQCFKVGSHYYRPTQIETTGGAVTALVQVI